MSFSVVGTALAGAAASAVVSKVMAPKGGASSVTNPGAAAAADPFASQRGQYQTQLNSLMANPSSVSSTPGYQFTLDQGLNSVQAGNAAKGIGSSGANDAAQMQYASGLASQTYQQDFNNLAMLSGASINGTGAASQAITAGNNTANSAIGSVAGAVGKGASQLWNTYGPGSGGGGPTSDGSVVPTNTPAPVGNSPAPTTFGAQPLFGGSSAPVGFSGYGS